MDAKTARRILKVSEKASMEEIRRRYRRLAKVFHPDVPETGDSKHFVLISTAYYTLQVENVGLKVDETIKDDIGSAFHLKNIIDSHIEDARDQFMGILDRIERDTMRQVKKYIYESRNKSQLRKTLEKDVPNCINKASARLKVAMKNLAKDIGKSNSEYIFEIFNEMYKENRKYWLINLYRNPTVVGGAITGGFIYALKEIPSIASQLPALSEAVSPGWIYFAVLAVVLASLLFQYFLLNPRRQFLPPGFSTSRMHETITSTKDNLPATVGELMAGGGL